MSAKNTIAATLHSQQLNPISLPRAASGQRVITSYVPATGTTNNLIVRGGDEDFDDEDDEDEEDWDDEEEEDWDEWDDEDWDDEDFDDEDFDDEDEDEDIQEPVPVAAPTNKRVPLDPVAREAADAEAREKQLEKIQRDNLRLLEVEKIRAEAAAKQVAEARQAEEESAQQEEAIEALELEPVLPVTSQREEDFLKLKAKYDRKGKEYKELFALHSDKLKGLDPDNPRDLADIKRLMDIIGSQPQKKKKLVTPKISPSGDPIVNFSARNIAVRDAFATLARISGKSITVSGSIQERDSISVVEINDQPFTKAFFSLVQAAGVDFTVLGDNYTILRKSGASQTKIFSLDSAEVDLSLDLADRVTDVSYDNEDLSTIIKDLANRYGVDIVLTATPTERVTLRLRSVTIEEALDLVLSGSQFAYVKTEETFVVFSQTNKNFALDRKTIFFPLKYLEAKEVTKLLPADLKTLVQVSDVHNALIAEGSKSQLEQIYDFIRTVDKPVPQIELDVKLVEVSKNTAFAQEIISNTQVFGVQVGDPVAVAGQGADGRGLDKASFSLGRTTIFKNEPNFSQDNTFSQIKVKQKLVVTSGKSAKINFDQDTNIVLGDADNGNNGAGVVQNQKLVRITAGNSLNITPVVSGDLESGGGIISITVEVEVSENSGGVNAQGVPALTTRRRLSSEVQVGDGETLSIGGIFTDNKSSSGRELPFIARIPILGSLLSNRSRSKVDTELIVLITPQVKSVLDESGTTQVQADSGTRNF